MTASFSQLSTDALSPGQLPESVKSIIKTCIYKSLSKNVLQLLTQALNQKSLYLILKGSVSIILREDDDREIVVAYLNAGDFFGEMGSL